MLMYRPGMLEQPLCYHRISAELWNSEEHLSRSRENSASRAVARIHAGLRPRLDARLRLYYSRKLISSKGSTVV